MKMMTQNETIQTMFEIMVIPVLLLPMVEPVFIKHVSHLQHSSMENVNFTTRKKKMSTLSFLQTVALALCVYDEWMYFLLLSTHFLRSTRICIQEFEK